MKKMKKLGAVLLAMTLTLGLSACGEDKEKSEASKKDSYSVGLVTDLGGVDDKSFNQSAWEGLQEWGKENNLEKGVGGYTYYQSNSDSEYVPHLNSAIDDGFDMIVGIGFKLQPALEEVAEANPDRQFVIIDSVVEDMDNVLSVLFRANESSYLAGVAAAKTTKSNKIGFIGGQAADVIELFEAGFEAGAKSVNPDIEVVSQYAGTFGDAAKGKSIAAAMYKSGIDIIFHAAGDTGNGVFSEATDLMNADPENKIWVIGVDRDQEDEGQYDSGNLTLTSVLKSVGAVTKSIANDAKEGEFLGGTTQVYGLKEGGVDITKGQLSDELMKEIEEVKEKIISGEIEVPEVPSKD